MFCSLLFVVVDHAGFDMNSLMRGGLWGKLHRPPSQLLFALQQSSIDSHIFVQYCDFCLTRLHSMPPLSEYCHDVWYANTRMVWLPVGEKILMIRLFVSTESTNVARQTDRQTPRDGIGRTCIASRGKKRRSWWHNMLNWVYETWKSFQRRERCFYRAMLCIAERGLRRRKMCVHHSATRRQCVDMAGRVFKLSPTTNSPSFDYFPNQTLWQYPDGTP